MPTPVAPTEPTASPATPDRADRNTFSARATAWADWLKNHAVSELYALAVNAYNNAVLAEAAAVSTAADAVTATTKASDAAASALTAINAPGTAATSTSSLTVGTGGMSLTIQTGKSIVVGMEVVIAYTATPTTRMVGTVTGYNSGTGVLDVTVTSVSGSGTQAAWTISLTAAGGSADSEETLTNKTALALTNNLEARSGPDSSAFMDRNKIIGHFEQNQRALTSVGDDAYCCDRWYVLTESGSVTVGQISDPESGAPWGWKLTQPDASPKRMGLATIIEAKNIKAFRSAAMNFFMRVKPSFSGNVRYAILEHTGTADVVTSDVVNDWSSTTFTASNFFIAGLNIIKTGTVTPGAATYGEFSDYGVMGASLSNAILFVWTESAQAQNATLELNRPQFEPGAVHTPHEWRKNELSLCQRYYEKSYKQSIIPGTNLAGYTDGNFAISATVDQGSSQYVAASIQFAVQKRDTPNFLYWDTAGNSGKYSTITAGGLALAANVGALTASYIGDRSGWVTAAPGIATMFVICWVAEKEL